MDLAHLWCKIDVCSYVLDLNDWRFRIEIQLQVNAGIENINLLFDKMPKF